MSTYATKLTSSLITRPLSRYYSAKNSVDGRPDVVYFRNSKAHPTSSRSYALLIVPSLTFCLGTWQLYRLKWKLGLIDERTTRMRITPLTMDELPDDLNQIRELEYRRVKVTGEFDHNKEIYLVPRSPISSMGGGLVSTSSTHGAHVITPFKVADSNTVILVDRGWVPRRRINPDTRKEAQVTGEVTITGVLRNSEKENTFSPENQAGSRNFQIRNIDEMSAALNTAPVLLDATKENDIPGGPAGGQTIVQLRNEHLNYAFTWYTLSALTLLLWYLKYVKRKSFSR